MAWNTRQLTSCYNHFVNIKVLIVRDGVKYKATRIIPAKAFQYIVWHKTNRRLYIYNKRILKFKCKKWKKKDNSLSTTIYTTHTINTSMQ